MKISRVWAMPDKNTFDIKPINKLIHRYNHPNSVDPFANKNRIATITNDINTEFDTTHHMDALEFLKTFESGTIDFVLYDPPYSPRQVSEVYKSLGMTVNMQTTQSSYWSRQKREIGRIVKQGGVCISFGWNSAGIGIKYGFQIIEILLVSHGGAHNDTIVTVERKNNSQIIFKN